VNVRGEVQQAGRRADRSGALDAGVRAGLVLYALLHLVIAWLGLQLALGDRDDRLDHHGALHELAQHAFGAVVLWLVAVGMVSLVAWRVLELFFEHRHEDPWDRWRHRGVAVGKGAAYALIGASAFGVVLGDGGSRSGQTEETWTARLLSWPAGPWLVGLVGVCFLAYAGAMVWRGLTGRHREHLTAEGRSGESGTFYLALGTVGYVAKGTAFGIVGGLFIWAGLTHDPEKSGGLDQALGRLLHQPAGPWLLGAVSLGFGCYGLFQLARARHLSR
jgi:Domain of Unknown Function (DUF1206)